MIAFSATATRVIRNTPDEINRRIAQQIERNVHYVAEHLDEIGARLENLDQEWDIERVLEANASTLVIAAFILAATVDRRFLIMPGLVAGFLLQHALQGWCPPVPFFRKRGVRTASGIERERYALKALRGDFRLVLGQAHLAPEHRAEAALKAVRA